MLLAFLLGGTAPSPATGCGDGVGDFCGGGAQDVASAPSSGRPTTDIGNPINLVTGNKHQREVDYRAPDSALEFVRHYNSTNADFDIGHGQGWHGSYDTRLFRAGDGYDIVQSDGRRVLFRDIADDGAGRRVVRATSPSDGLVREFEGRHVWELPDGREIAFQGSFLVRIDYPGKRFLTLRYRTLRLASVTDESGRSLAFHWTPGRVGLDGYETLEFGPSAGHLARVTLPDGTAIAYDYDNRGNLTRVRYPDGTDRRYHYDEPTWPNHLTGLTDRTGRRLATWAYHPDGRAWSAEHAGGVERITLDYELPVDDGGIGTTLVTSALGAQSAYTWRRDVAEGHALLLSSDGPGCESCPVTGMRYTYTRDHQLASATHASGTTRRHVHDGAGRLLEVWMSAPGVAERLTLRHAYEGDEPRPVLIALPSVYPDGEHVTEIAYGADRLPDSVTERGFAPLGPSVADGFAAIERTTRFEHDVNGRLVAIDGPRGDVEDITRFRHDEHHRLVGIDRPDGRSIDVVERDAHGRVSVLRAGPGSPLRLMYDANGHIASVERAGRRLRYRHDAEGRLLSLTDPDGRETTFAHDAAARLVGVTDDLGRLDTLTHDAESRVVGTAFVGADGQTIRSASYAYDALGRLERMSRRNHARRPSTSANVVDSFGFEQTLELDYDERDRLLSVLDLDTLARADFARHELDGTTTLTLPDAARGTATTASHRDAAGREAGVTDPRENRVGARRDDFGRVVIEWSADRGITRHGYDEADSPVLREDGAGRTTRWVRDAANRPLRLDNADGTIRYAWHPANGRLVEIDDGTTRETFSYDDEARLIGHARHIDDRAFVTRYTHDASGRLARKVLPDDQVLRYHYHEDGALRGTLRAITRESLFGLRRETLVAEIDADARDGRSGHLAHNGIATERHFDSNGRPLSIDVAATLRLDYTFDDDGRIVGLRENGAAGRYAYRDGRLIGAITPVGTFAYAYDAGGNRTAERVRTSDGRTRVRRHRYPADGGGDRLLSSVDTVSGERTDFRSGAIGTPLTGPHGLAYQYDANDRPVRVFERGVLLAEYVYNGFGERVKKVVHRGDGRRVTYFLYDGSRLTAEIDADETPMRHTVHVDGQPLLHLVGRDVYAIHTDQLGTPRILTDADGTTVWRADYTPFGEARVAVDKLRFAHRLPGQYHDAETGTHYNYLRDYDPGTGRYLTPDPIGLAGGPNAYAYAANDPLGRHDALGLKPSAEFGQDGNGGWRIGVAQYRRLKALFEADDAPGYYDYLYELTGHAIFDEFAETLRPLGEQEAVFDVSPILAILRDLGDIGGFSQIEQVQCTPDRRPIYRIPGVGPLVEGAFQAAGVQLGAQRFVEKTVRDTFTFGVDLIAWTFDMSALGALGDVLRERRPDLEIPAWVPSLDEGIDKIEKGTTIAAAIVAKPSLIWDSIKDPIVRDWAEGRYGEVVAGVTLEVATLPLGFLKAGKIAEVLTAAKRLDAVSPGEFLRQTEGAITAARQQGAGIDVLTDGARQAGVLDEFLASGTLRTYELDDLVEAGKLTPEEAARARPAPLPPFRNDFAEHVVKVDRDPETGKYVIDGNGSIKGGHNADEFREALANPRGDGVPAFVVNRVSIENDAGDIIGETIKYQVPGIYNNGKKERIGKSIVDEDGNVQYKPPKDKTVYFSEKISDAEMLSNVRRAGAEYYDRKRFELASSAEKKGLHEDYVMDGVKYHVYLEKDPMTGEVVITNVHIK